MYGTVHGTSLVEWGDQRPGNMLEMEVYQSESKPEVRPIKVCRTLTKYNIPNVVEECRTS
ncbi:hypothetical protein HJC23_007188 [Cyclotella cryptica]|uniref:Uncharacterized protein n=1 Tax=Cyclotella cryptica TaxID=29204 RepID=A0ABD3QQE8_9STRA